MKKVGRKLKVALILDNLEICSWQQEAFNNVKDLIDVRVILNCKNTKVTRNLKKHFFYYLLNYISLKNKKTKKLSFKAGKSIIEDFHSDYELGWQTIPKKNLSVLQSEDIDIVIKFGMNLLKITKDISSYKILSFHHGDPSKYRGRPAGFYEILHDDDKVGVIVQLLSNGIDEGEVYAFSEAQIFNYSYKKTALSFFSISRFMLRRALINLVTKTPIEIKKNGQNFKLPSNLLVIVFLLKLLLNLSKRVVYGIFFEKKWKVALSDEKINLNKNIKLSTESFSVLPISGKYSFYADPFFSKDGRRLRLEALSKKTGLGSLLEVDLSNFKTQNVFISGEHYSYPFSFLYDGEEYLLPEVASHSPPYYFNFNKGNKDKIYLRGLETKRIVDATLLDHEGHVYLFFGDQLEAQNVLNLWVSTGPRDVFYPHPSSPISISPGRARMGGSIVKQKNIFYRFGQNNKKKYGEHINIMKIVEISPQSYREVACGRFSIVGFNGPHTINFDQKQKKFVIDYYEEKFSFFAGYRRLMAKLRKS